MLTSCISYAILGTYTKKLLVAEILSENLNYSAGDSR